MKRVSRMIVSFGAIITIFLGLNAYIGWNVYLFLSHYNSTMSAVWFSLMFCILAFSYLLGRWGNNNVVGRLFKVMGSYYLAFMEFLVIILPFADISAWLLRKVGYSEAFYIPVVGWTTMALLVILMVWGSYNAWSPILRTYRLPISKQGGGRRKLTIAVASDIHLGNIVGNRHLKRLIKGINRMEPDLILLPGDIIDDSIEPFMRNKMADSLKQLHATFGVYAVLGNHEYYGDNIEQYITEMSSIGICVLRDETVSIDNDHMVIAGRKDRTAESMDPNGRLSIEELLDHVDKSKPIIVMDHQPYGFQQAAEAGADILLCGHTHRGQFAPNHWVTGRLFELDWGYMLKQHMHVVVSSGFGTWGPPIRLASRCEIIRLDVELEG
ncbi:MAG TPA: metallophosphoesterase [Paenibacillus sp.]